MRFETCLFTRMAPRIVAQPLLLLWLEAGSQPLDRRRDPVGPSVGMNSEPQAALARPVGQLEHALCAWAPQVPVHRAGEGLQRRALARVQTRRRGGALDPRDQRSWVVAGGYGDLEGVHAGDVSAIATGAASGSGR